MNSRLFGAVVGLMLATALVVLSVMGGYRLASSGGSSEGKVRLAQTGATRTWVSGVGDDANPCARTAPCKTFAGAISRTQVGGEIDTLDPGGFGAVTITFPITIDGSGGGLSSVLVSGTNGINVVAGANDVVILRHLQIQGLGTSISGIRFTSGKALVLDDVTIDGFQRGVNVTLTADGSRVSMRNVRVHNNQVGAWFTTSVGTVKATISHSEMEGNSGHGLIAADGADVDLGTSVVAGNASIGAGCTTNTASPCTLHITRTQLDHNWSAVFAQHYGGATGPIQITISDDDIFGNGYGINLNGEPAPGTRVYSFVNNRFVNNGSDGAANGSLTQK